MESNKSDNLNLIFSSEWKAEDFAENANKINSHKEMLSKQLVSLKVPLNFKQTVEAYDPKKNQPFSVRDKVPLNNQTEAYLKMLNIDPSVFENFLFYDHEKKGESGFKEIIKDTNDDEIDLGMDFGVSSTAQNQAPTQAFRPASNVDVNISLEDLPFK